MTEQIGIYNFATGENIVRDMTDEEIAEHELKLQATAATEQEATAKAEAKAAIAERLGLSADELATLLG